MRFFNINGILAKARRRLSSSASVQDADVTDPQKLAEILRSTLLRLSELEAKSPPEWVEFETATSTGGALIRLNHGFGSPVRWWATAWTRPVGGGAYPTTDHDLVQDALSDTNTLVLRSYTAGRVVIRIEPAIGVMEA